MRNSSIIKTLSSQFLTVIVLHTETHNVISDCLDQLGAQLRLTVPILNSRVTTATEEAASVNIKRCFTDDSFLFLCVGGQIFVCLCTHENRSQTCSRLFLDVSWQQQATPILIVSSTFPQTCKQTCGGTIFFKYHEAKIILKKIKCFLVKLITTWDDSAD